MIPVTAAPGDTETGLVGLDGQAIYPERKDDL